MLRQRTSIDKINPLKEGEEILLQHCVDLWETTPRYFATVTGRGPQEELRYVRQEEFSYHFMILFCLFAWVVVGFFGFVLVFKMFLRRGLSAIFPGVTCASFGVCWGNFLLRHLYPEQQ